MWNDLIELTSEWFPDATPAWIPLAAFAMCLAVLLIILAGLFPSIPERLAHIEWGEHGRRVWAAVRAVFRRRRSSGGRHHESPEAALASDSEGSSVDSPAVTARLGAMKS